MDGAPRDWNAHPAIAEMAAPAVLYAVGDPHGDYDRLANLLASAKLIDAVAPPNAVRWSGGSAVLVCTGGLIDKFDQSRNVIALFRALETQASRAGGRVVVTLGNHEAAFLASDGADPRGKEFADELRAAGIRPADVARGTDAAGIGAWLRDLPVAAKVGDWFFCHAGNTGGRSLTALKADLERDIAADGFAAAILSDPNSILEARMHPRPWWEADDRPIGLRNAGRPAATTPEQRLRTSVEALGAKHLVFGHQPGKVDFANGQSRAAGEVYSVFAGMAFLIDTGMSRGAPDGGIGAVLKVQDGRATALYADGRAAVLVRCRNR